MSNIDYIRDMLKKFEENLNNEEGVEYLRSALEEMARSLKKLITKMT